MTNISQKTDEFIWHAGVGEQGINAQQFIDTFISEMNAGINGSGSLAMIPTYLSCADSLPMEKYSVAIDAGGTHLRTALVCFRESGVEISNFESTPMPGTHGHVTWEEFISIVVNRIRPLMSFTKKIAICISFPTIVEPSKDGVIQRLTKEVNITGFENRHICEDLLEELNVDGAQAVVLNDTTAVLMSAISSGAESKSIIGLINGTGTNTCCQLPKRLFGIDEDGDMIVDIESGGFTPPERCEIDKVLDMNTLSPGVYQEEKLVSGAYLGEICRLALRNAAEAGIFSEKTALKCRELKMLSTPEADSFGAGEVNAIFDNKSDAEAARTIIRQVFARSAKHIACTLTAILKYTAVEKGASITISADGSVFRKSMLFKFSFEKYMSEYASDWNLSYVAMDNSTLIGTAVAALIN